MRASVGRAATSFAAPAQIDRAEARRRVAPAAFVPALALPILFLHVRYQPAVHVRLRSTTVGIELSDLAVLAVAAAAVLAGVRNGWEPLRKSRRLWLFAGLFLALVVAGTFYPLLWEHHYPFLKHLVTAAKFWEYALLAPALPLLVRRRADSLPLLYSIAAWSTVATGWGLLQFAGLVNEFEGKRPLQREPSFVGIHDFAALSGAAFAVGFAVLVLGGGFRGEHILGSVASVAGGIGLILSGAVAGVIGVAVAAAVVVALAATRGRLAKIALVAVAASVAAAAVGVVLMRSGEIPQAIRGLGIGSQPSGRRSVESYVERSLVAYIGLRMFLDHPVIGVGWQGSNDLENYKPYLADAHRKFPTVPEVAFPAPQHPWGVQNAYLETLTDLGVVGAFALLALFLAGLVLGLRAAWRAPPTAIAPAAVGVLWLLVAAGTWNGLGLVAGIPLDALTWLGFGLVAAAAAWRDGVVAG